jgi:hypothetical protein
VAAADPGGGAAAGANLVRSASLQRPCRSRGAVAPSSPTLPPPPLLREVERRW